MTTLRVTSRLIATVVGLVILGSTWSANAVPFKYRFQMPAFDGGGFEGETSVLDIVVDNGDTSTLEQTYLNTQIIAFELLIGEVPNRVGLRLNINDDRSSSRGSVAYVTTDALGFPTLDLTASEFSAFELEDLTASAGLIQLLTGATPNFQVFALDDVGFVTGLDPVSGIRVPLDDFLLPEPGTLALFVIGLGGLGVLTRRRAG